MPTQRSGRPLTAFALVTALAVALVITIAGAAGAAQLKSAPGTVVIRDTMDRSEVVIFLVPDGASIGQREVAAAAAAAGIPNNGIEERSSDQPGVRELRLRTSLSSKTALFSRRIDGRVIQRLDIFDQGRVVLSLHPWARVVEGQVQPLEFEWLTKRYTVNGHSGVAYGIPASAMLRALALLLLLILVPYAALRMYARRVSRQDLPASDKAHRMRASLLIAGLLLPLLLLAVLFLGGFLGLPAILLGELAPGLSRHPAIQATISMLFLFAIFLATVLPASRAVLPYYRQLRGIEPTRKSRIGNLRLGLAFLLPVVLWLVFFNVVSGSGSAQTARLVLLAVGWIALLVFVPSLAVRLMPTRPLDEPTRQRLEALLRRTGVRVRAIRVLETREQKMANALVMGLLPRLRYVLVTDYLLEHLEQDEVEATVAHEIGHAKQHHLLIKLGGFVAFAGVVALAVVVAGSLIEGAVGGAIVFAFPIVMLLGIILIQGGLGLVLERKADDYAARQVGVDPTTRALEKIAELNLLKRRTGLAWNLLTNHPGIAQRVERLQKQQQQERQEEPRTALSGAGPRGSGGS
jgi:Zn-dependent protease with chaperone function